MSNINFSGYDWYPHEEWGLIHPDKPWNWYSPDCVNVVNRQLILSVKHQPKKITLPVDNKPGETYDLNPTYGIGLVSSKQYFGCGVFHLEAILPKGVGLWPAFWLYDHNEWPPEIDIFEGYSGKRGDYSNGFIKRLFYPYNVESCFHSHKDRGIPNIKPEAYSRSVVKKANYDPFKMNTYSLYWDEYCLIFYINGFVTRIINDQRIMNYLKNRKMRVLINTHVQIGYDKKVTQESPFIINSFFYYKAS